MLNNNIIHKQIIDINSRENLDGIALQKTTENFIKFSLQLKLETLFEEYNEPNTHVLIDKLSVEVDMQSAEFDGCLSAKILSELQILLDNKITSVDKEPPISYADRFIQALAFYLANGYLPWWAQVKDRSDWQKYLQQLVLKPQLDVNWDILKATMKNPVSLERLCSMLPEIQLWAIIDLFSNVSADEGGMMRDDISKMIQIIPEQSARKTFPGKIQRTLLLSIATEYHPEKIRMTSIKNLFEEFRKAFGFNYILLKEMPLKNALLQTVVEKLFANSEPLTKAATEKLTALQQNTKSPARETIPNKEVRKPPKIVDQDQAEIYINNAGLCLVAPYLPRFFKSLKLIKGENILNLNKAVSLLNFMVGGPETFADFEVVLPKMFCGAGLNTVSQKFRLNAEDKKECYELLTAVIENWEVLKNTSVIGLQQSFLQREGKLSRQRDNWLLSVEQKPYDMLLNDLPWSFHMIRHPWMKEMILVEWI